MEGQHIPPSTRVKQSTHFQFIYKYFNTHVVFLTRSTGDHFTCVGCFVFIDCPALRSGPMGGRSVSLDMPQAGAVVALNIPHKHFEICVSLLAPLLIKSWSPLGRVDGPNSYPHWLHISCAAVILTYCGGPGSLIYETALAKLHELCDCPGGPLGGLVAVCDVIRSG